MKLSTVKLARQPLVLLGLFLIAPMTSAQEWVAYTSDNVTVFSDAPESAAVDVMESFELFRLVTLALLDLPNIPESERLTIVAFNRRRDFNRLAVYRDLPSFMEDSIHGPRIVLMVTRGATNWGAQSFHEYARYLTSQRATLNYPNWFLEGISLVLSSTEIAESSIIMGKPPSPFRQGLVPLDRTVRNVFDMTPEGGDIGYHFTSWLTTHYLLIDSFGDETRRQQLRDFLRRLGEGDDPTEALIESYGVAADEMQRKVDAYGQRRSVGGLVWPHIEYTGDFSRRVLEQGEQLYRLGAIAVDLNELEEAHRLFDAFADVALGSPFEASVMTTRAIAYLQDGKIHEGDALIEAVLASNPDDADVLAGVARYAFDRFLYERDQGSDKAADSLMQSIEYAERALERDPAKLDALYYLGLALEARGSLQLAVDTLLKGYDISRGVRRLNFSLARMLIKGHQNELAANLILHLYSATDSEQKRERYRNLQQALEGGNVDVEELDGTL